MHDDVGAFAFEVIGEREVAITHVPTTSTWRFRVEQGEPRRCLMPKRTLDLPRATKGMVEIRRAAFGHAVAQARLLGLID